jgi:hypothetical protein
LKVFLLSLCLLIFGVLFLPGALLECDRADCSPFNDAAYHIGLWVAAPCILLGLLGLFVSAVRMRRKP